MQLLSGLRCFPPPGLGSAMWSLTSRLDLRKGTFKVPRTQSCALYAVATVPQFSLLALIAQTHHCFFTHSSLAPPFSTEIGFSKAPCMTPDDLHICSLQSPRGGEAACVPPHGAHLQISKPAAPLGSFPQMPSVLFPQSLQAGHS